MLIKWECAFQIPDSTVQLAEAFVKIVEWKNINDNSEVFIVINDTTGEIIVKEYTKTYNKTFNNIEEVYQELLKDFNNAVVES